MFAVLPKRKNCHLIKIISALLLFIVFYNVVLSSYIRLTSRDFRQTFLGQSDPEVLWEIEKNKKTADLFGKQNIHVGQSMVKYHEKIMSSKSFSNYDDNLFLRQGPFKLPKGLKYLGGKIKFGLFPSSNNDDRIWNQMRYVPHEVLYVYPLKKKSILVLNEDQIPDKDVFDQCPVNQCYATSDKNSAKSADVILWMSFNYNFDHKRPPNQTWIFYNLESPLNSHDFGSMLQKNEYHQKNWIASYRYDSTIVTPYYKYTPYDLVNPVPDRYPLPKKNYAKGKSKMIAWFVSNCASENKRMEVANSLAEHVKVDIYGMCSDLKCSRSNSDHCFDMLNKEYKFYLAFENSNCKDYITEKFFLNGLSNNVIPIVMGAHPDEYKRVAPPHSFIHIEHFPTINELAKYLIYLNLNDTAYNEYFSWKKHGLVDTNTFFWCRLCMMSHITSYNPSNIRNMIQWWTGRKKYGNGTQNHVCIGANRWT